MVYHGILWVSMGNFSILLTVLVLFYCRFNKIRQKAQKAKGDKNDKKK